MKILKNRGFISLAVIVVILIILGNFLMSYRMIINKSKRISYITKKNERDDLIYNVDIFTFDKIREIDRSISLGKYRDSIEYFAGVNDKSKLWLEKSGTLSNTGYRIKRAFLWDKIFYEENKTKEINFIEFLEYCMKVSRTREFFKFELIKYYDVKNTKKKIIIIGKISLYYSQENRDVFSPSKIKLEELMIKVEEAI